MYYRKYYEGIVEAGSVTATVPSINGAANMIQSNHTEILNRAVADILAGAGMDCLYDPETYILTIEGCPFNLFVMTNMSWRMIKKNSSGSDQIVTQATSSSYGPFSGVNYKFYITVRGEPKGLLAVYIGTYSNPAYVGYGFQIGFGKDIRDGSDIVFSSAAGGNSFGVQKRDGSFPRGAAGNSVYAFGTYLVKDAGLSCNGNEIPLIEIFSSNGFFKMNHCYFSSNELTAANFYNIGGDIYYCMNQYILVKCITELPE